MLFSVGVAVVDVMVVIKLLDGKLFISGKGFDDYTKQFALCGFDIISHDFWGVYPLCGNLINVHEASIEDVNDKEIKNIEKMLGLEQNKHYSSTKELRYGKIMLMTDQDYD
ncbi:21039_t:CDS:2, partial [Entrophospora sp. SA101]